MLSIIRGLYQGKIHTSYGCWTCLKQIPNTQFWWNVKHTCSVLRVCVMLHVSKLISTVAADHWNLPTRVHSPLLHCSWMGIKDCHGCKLSFRCRVHGVCFCMGVCMGRVPVDCCAGGLCRTSPVCLNGGLVAVWSDCGLKLPASAALVCLGECEPVYCSHSHMRNRP